jgi:anti-sigma B factor antagonist
MQPLTVERTAVGGTDLLVAEGEIDIGSAPRLISALSDVVLSNAQALVIDLTEVSFMDSTGLALMLNAQRRVTRRGHEFAIACPEGPVRRVFEVTDMLDTLCVRTDRHAALETVAEDVRQPAPLIGPRSNDG